MHACRVRGHMVAGVDLLGLPRPEPAELDPTFYGLTPADLDRPVTTSTGREPEVHTEVGTVRKVIRRMRNTYCRFIGVQFMHIDELSVRKWVQRPMEVNENRPTLSPDQQCRHSTRQTDADR